MTQPPQKTYTITARGHPLLRGTHRATLELTRDEHLTSRGDCIVGVAATTGCLDLPTGVKNAIQSGKTFHVQVSAGDFHDDFMGQGSPSLELTHPTDLVFRMSTFTCPRTILIKCTKAARDINRKLIQLLKNSSQLLTVKLEEVP